MTYRFEDLRLNLREIPERRKQLLYDCASEAVADARLVLPKLREQYTMSYELFEALDDLLATAQHKAGAFAIRAARTNMRSHTSYRQVIASDELQSTAYYPRDEPSKEKAV